MLVRYQLNLAIIFSLFVMAQGCSKLIQTGFVVSGNTRESSSASFSSQFGGLPHGPESTSTVSNSFDPGTMPMEVGGSNYIIWDLGRYANEHNSDAWYADDGLQSVVGRLEKNPKLIRKQLKSMYANGQRRIAIVLFFTDLNRDGVNKNAYGHVVNSAGGRLADQQVKNLRRFLKMIQNVGFTGIDVRFASQGISTPETWTYWDEDHYQTNWNFIASTHELIESELKDSSIRRIYDLGVELGGIESGMTQVYVRRLWGDYVYTFGADDTYGFSIAWYRGRLARLQQDLSQVGGSPSRFAVDIYDSAYANLKDIASELQSIGRAGTPVILQEGYYNDRETLDSVLNARRDFGLNITYIMQWAIYRNSNIPHFAVNAPIAYDQYLGGNVMSPFIYAAGRGCDDGNCLWINGGNFYKDVIIQLRNSQNELLEQFEVDRLQHSKNGQQQVITLRIAQDRAIQDLNSGAGVYVYLYSPDFNSWSSGIQVR